MIYIPTHSELENNIRPTVANRNSDLVWISRQQTSILVNMNSSPLANNNCTFATMFMYELQAVYLTITALSNKLCKSVVGKQRIYTPSKCNVLFLHSMLKITVYHIFLFRCAFPVKCPGWVL